MLPFSDDHNVNLLFDLKIVPSPKSIYPRSLTRTTGIVTNKTTLIPKKSSNGFKNSCNLKKRSNATEVASPKRHKSKRNVSTNIFKDHSYNKYRPGKEKLSASLSLDERLGTIESTYFGPNYLKRLNDGIGNVQIVNPGSSTRLDERLGSLESTSFRPNCGPEYIQPAHLKFEPPSNTQLFKMRNPENQFLLGYRPFTGDFDEEFDNEAEKLLCLAGKLNEVRHCGFNAMKKRERKEEKLLEELQVTLVDSYNVHLKERNRRKKIVRDNGLINLQGSRLHTSRLQTRVGRKEIKKLSCVSKLVSAAETNHFCASLEAMYDKRAETNKLIYYRTQRGITTKRSMAVFESLRGERENAIERIDLRKAMEPQVVRKKKRSVPIYHYARYRDLSVKEAELCSSLGLLPEFFLETKSSLISDCQKNKGMLLKKARKMVKIDVNKTRKIFDLLMEEGAIWLPASEEVPKTVGSQGKKQKNKKTKKQTKE